MFVYLILPGHNCCAVDLRNGLWWRSIWRWLPPSSHLHCRLQQRCVAHFPFVFLRCVYKLKSGQSSCTSLFIHCCSWISLLPPNNISAEPNQCCGYKAIMSVMLCLTANSLSVMWDNHTAENRDWISWWLSSAGFLHPTPLGFQWPPRLRPCHYRLLVFAIMPCLLLSSPSAAARRLCNTTYDAWSSAPLSLRKKSIFPISSRLALSNSSILLLSSLCGVCSHSLLPVWANSGSPFMVTN